MPTEELDTLLTGRPPRLTDSEPVCLAVAQALLGYHSEACWIRFAIEGAGARLGRRLLAMTCAIRHNRATGRPVTRSLIAYGH
ncbi:hypothetical protein [Kitasatospora sp. NPDC018619]|uniref:hypothetical protein n=1 Tax=unclassified Kitasatospora TaxID=2633591 RepID=UPI0037873CA9